METLACVPVEPSAFAPSPSSAPAADRLSANAQACPSRRFSALDLPPGPLAPGLPNTPRNRVHNFWLGVLVRGLEDGDTEWVESDDFLRVCVYVGINLLLAQRIRERYRQGKITSEQLAYLMRSEKAWTYER